MAITIYKINIIWLLSQSLIKKSYTDGNIRLTYFSSPRSVVPKEVLPLVQVFVRKLDHYLPDEYVQELQGND